MICDKPFETYRRAGAATATLPRLAAGIAIIVACWLGVTLAVILGGALLTRSLSGAAAGHGFAGGLMTSRSGTLTALTSFAGIWVGAFIAMRWIHREPLSALFGAMRRIRGGDFAKGLIAVLITSALSEAALYLVMPHIARSGIAWTTWLLFLVPVLALAFLQTSAEELMFRGYLVRGLAARFRSPLIWAALPTLAFTLLHLNAAAPLALNLCIFLSIGAFALVLVLLVRATGNLGAGMGMHLGNNLGSFLIVSHESALSSFALYNGRPLGEFGWTAGMTAYVSAVGVIGCLLTALLLLSQRSPLAVAARLP